MLLFFAFILVCASESFDRGFNANIAWTNSLEQGLERAKAENKKAFVLIHKTWCGACKRLKSSFSNAAIELASKDFVMINLEDNEEPADDLYKPDGGYIPRILFVDPNTKQLLPIINEGGNPQYKYFYSTEEQIIAAMEAARKALLFSMSKKNATKILPGPCHMEAEESRKCMEDANGVKSKCTDKFLAYKDCKSKIYVAKQKERDEVFFGKK